ncbi:MAG: hypothetical protein ACRBN8_44050 [Nannocystales bacterium]
MGKLVACPSCSTYVRADESACPHCESRVRNELGTVVRTAGAMLMGLSLTACPADDDSDDTGASSATMTAGSSGTTDPTDSTDPTMSSTGSDMSGTVSSGPGPEPAYGVGTTDFPSTSSSGGSSSSGGGTDGTSTGEGSSTSIGGPEYGVPETTGR